jgi:SAM-dependent methyltransferase
MNGVSRNAVLVVPDLTLWEKVGTTLWGAYTTEIERRVILQGQALRSKPTKALEIGCEGGRWSKMLADMGWQMTCIDVNPKALEVCQKKVPSAKCILASQTDQKIPCESGSLGYLLCMEVAQVIQSDWFLPEAFRVLGEGGVLVGMVWNRTSWRGVMTRARYMLNRDDEGFYERSYPAWRKKARQIGFQMTHEEGFCWAPFGRMSNSTLIPASVKLERAFQLPRFVSVSPWVAFIARKADCA